MQVGQPAVNSGLQHAPPTSDYSLKPGRLYPRRSASWLPPPPAYYQPPIVPGDARQQYTSELSGLARAVLGRVRQLQYAFHQLLNAPGLVSHCDSSAPQERGTTSNALRHARPGGGWSRRPPACRLSSAYPRSATLVLLPVLAVGVTCWTISNG